MASSQCDKCEMVFDNDDELSLHILKEHFEKEFGVPKK